ncbi:MAG: hypothetical protein LUD27_07325 [Clostridia bacterium]|nr:hypothetical protein [Clostridia bacterium]
MSSPSPSLAASVFKAVRDLLVAFYNAREQVVGIFFGLRAAVRFMCSFGRRFNAVFLFVVGVAFGVIFSVYISLFRLTRKSPYKI